MHLPSKKKKRKVWQRWRERGISLAVQWLRFCTSTEEGTDSIPGLGTEISACCVKQIKKKKKKAKSYSLWRLSSQPDYLSQSPLQSSVSVTDLGSKEWVQIMSTTSGLSSILFAHQVDARAQGNERRAVLMLFTIPRTWKQPGCPLTDEGIKKLWCIYTMEYYSAKEEMHLSQF